MLLHLTYAMNAIDEIVDEGYRGYQSLQEV